MLHAMGMAMGFVTISDQNIERVLAHPPLIWRFVAPDDAEAFEMAAQPKQSFLSKLFGGKSAQAPAELHTEEGELHEADVDKAWHGLHYLLTGTAWEGQFPANFLLAGREVGDIDVGYGPARVLTSAEVRAVHNHLSSLTDEQIMARFNPDEMTRLEIYPDVWDRGEEELEYLESYLGDLRSFVALASDSGMGMVIYLT